jgi:hypothetical protein
VKSHELPRVEGIAGAAFAIYHGEVNEDSHGPLEWCRPVPDDQGEDLAKSVPELTLCIEPAHWEAFVNLGRGGAETQVDEVGARDAVAHEWNESEKMRLSDLGVRATYMVTGPVAPGSEPDCDFEIPFVA